MSAVATAIAFGSMPPPSSQNSQGLAPSMKSGNDASLSIVIPTFNEVDNIEELLRRIAACLAGVAWDVIVVDDDSPDGTADLVGRLGQADDRIRCLKRIGRRGLSSACLEGMAMSNGQFFAVIDADLQHDERLLPAMLRVLLAGRIDLVVGSRYLSENGMGTWTRSRRWLSRAATATTRFLLTVSLTDPMSGFFMLRREVIGRVADRLSSSGFKLLLDVVASSPKALRIAELPYVFSPRIRGTSKLDAAVIWSFLRLLVHQVLRRSCGRFCHFCCIGTSGVFVHFAVLAIGQGAMMLSFPVAQTTAVLVSLVSNFALNNRLTFGSSRLRGKGFVTGLSRFAVLCALGALVNVVVADSIFRLSGWRPVAVTTGILAGAVINYCTTSLLVWRRRSSPANV